MTTRAKFRCTTITLQQSSALRPGVKYDSESKTRYSDEEGNAVNHEDAYRPFDQPTVKLMAVTGGTPENETFFAASPAGSIDLTISNPNAAELFELGKEYYVDFTPAS